MTSQLSTIRRRAASRFPGKRDFESLADPVHAAGRIDTGGSRDERRRPQSLATAARRMVRQSRPAGPGRDPAQLALVPIILHYCSSEVLAAWLALYAAGNLWLVADFGLQPRAINRFLALKSCADSDGRSGHFFAGLQRVYTWRSRLCWLCSPSPAVSCFVIPCPVRFPAIGDFDVALAIMTAGMLLILPSNMVSSLYRSHGLYGRSVWLQSAAMLTARSAEVRTQAGGKAHRSHRRCGRDARAVQRPQQGADRLFLDLHAAPFGQDPFQLARAHARLGARHGRVRALGQHCERARRA